MYPLGHMGLAYFLVVIFNKLHREEFCLPAVLGVSLAPDIDILFSSIIVHRGFTHSIIVMTIVFVPCFLVLRTGFSYYIAALSHSLIGDYFTAYGVKLFWPISNMFYRAPQGFIVKGDMLVVLEAALFIGAALHYLYNRNITRNMVEK